MHFQLIGTDKNNVKHLVDEAKRRGCGKIYLETTSGGKSLYLSSGFDEMPDMMKYYGTKTKDRRS